MEPSLSTFDPHSVTAEQLAERFPDIGLFVAEDIVDSRRKNDGVFPDAEALVALGLTAELAQLISECAGPIAAAEPPAPAREPAAPASEPPAPVVESKLPAYELPSERPVAVAPQVVEPARTVFDVAAAMADESDVEEAFTAPPPRPAPAVVAAAPESAPPVAAAESAPPARSAPPVVAHAESAPPEAPSVPAPPEAPSVPAPKPPRRGLLVAAIVAVNVAVLGIGAAAYLQETRTQKTVVTISADVDVVKTEQAAAKERSDEALAKLDETRARLDEQAKSLAQTKSRMAAAEARMQDDERAAHEHEVREAQETAALANRVNRVEQKTYKLDEALKMIDSFDR